MTEEYAYHQPAKVLDKGFVRLVDHMGSDLSIVRSARVSFNADWRAGKDEGSDERLIKFLMRNGHTSPFESVVFTFEVKAPIFVVRQWHRHRTQSYNEISARYTELDEGFYVPDAANIGIQSKKNKQAREIGLSVDDLRDAHVREVLEDSHEKAFEVYKHLLGAKVPRELARSVLPVAAYTRMFTTVNLHNLFRFLHERLSPNAQYEIRCYAEAILNLISEICPTATEAFLENIAPNL